MSELEAGIDLEPGSGEIERIARMSREQVDALPYGLMLFDADGKVLLYNRYESELSRRRVEDVVGKSWFRDVAPCTRVAAFEGRFRAFVERATPGEVARFAFRFHFLHGAQDVEVTLAHAPPSSGDGRVFVIVNRRTLGDGGHRLDVTQPTAARMEDGRVRGGLGAALASPRLFWATLFDAADGDRSVLDAAFDRAARAWGRALLEGIEAYAERVHGRTLSALPTELAVALVDEAFAAQGLGRVELDFGGAESGVLGFAVRSVDLPVSVDEQLYAALLSEIAHGLTARRLTVVPFARHGEILRFAATTEGKARVLGALRSHGVEGREIARKAGLEVWE